MNHPNCRPARRRAVSLLIMLMAAAAPSGTDQAMANATAPAARPRVVRTDAPTCDIVIASFDVKDFGARGDGAADDAPAIQRALDAAAVAGGGVVFAPAGRYVCRAGLAIPTGVTLRGDWFGPDRPDKGSILLVETGRGEEGGPSFIRLNMCSGLQGFTFFHPAQQADDPDPYPWAIEQLGGDNATVRDVTLVNPWRGIKIGPQHNELHYVHNVYGTPLEQGILIDSTTDIGRLENVRFSPNYWCESGLPGAPAGEARARLERRLLERATGIVMGRSDWQYFTDVQIDGYRVGLRITRGEMAKTTPMGTSNAQLFNVYIDRCRTALLVEETNHIGLAVTRCRFGAAALPGALALRTGPAFDKGGVQFGAVDFIQRGETACRLEGSGVVTFQNCRFQVGRGHTASEGANPTVVDVAAGALILAGCDFDIRRPRIALAEPVRAAALFGNRFRHGKPRIDNHSRGDVQIDLETPSRSFGFVTPSTDHYTPPAPPRPASRRLYVVTDAVFGAAGDGQADDTAAIQAALDAARSRGGTVYLPAGVYRVAGSLRVPTGVELRGIWDVPHHTAGEGTVLFAVGGKGRPEGDPLVQLESRAGLRGVTIYYPDQDFRNVQPYPWAV
ncbi:MAG: glycoside hydrolase family 55 protein, partial [bacterium]|nr:glycoside hydrolase family 55 protein [bacterium]